MSDIILKAGESRCFKNTDGGVITIEFPKNAKIVCGIKYIKDEMGNLCPFYVYEKLESTQQEK